MCFEPRKKRRGIPTSAAHGLHFGIELIHKGRHREACARPFGLFENDSESFAHPVDGKSVILLARHHRFISVDHLPRPGRAMSDYVDRGLDV